MPELDPRLRNPNDAYQNIGSFNSSFADLLQNPASVQLRGRVAAIRRMKTMGFADLRDATGTVQTVFPTDPDLGISVLAGVSLGDILRVNGVPFLPRSQQPSLLVAEHDVVARFQDKYPDKFHGIRDVGRRREDFSLQLITDSDSFEFYKNASRLEQVFREDLNSLGFQEFETPVLRRRFQSGQARPFVAHHNSLGSDVYMRPTSEVELVQLIAGGFERVYELGKSFRNEGMDRMHSPEYSTLEAYSAYSDYEDMMVLAQVLIKNAALKAFGRLEFSVDGATVDLSGVWNQLTVDDALKKYGGFSLSDVETGTGLANVASSVGLDLENLTYSQGVSKLIEKLVVPKLVEPTFLKDFPVSVAPLGKTKPDDPKIVERAWACIAGIGFADISSNVTDPDDLQRRLELQDQESGVHSDHTDNPLVKALRYGIPPTAGIGIGINRLLMILGDRKNIRDTIVFPEL